MWGGFACSRNSLIGLNIFYFFVGVLLIILGSHWSSPIYIANLPIIGGVVASGVFLSLISVAGLVGAVKHHQVLLFFYMVILLIVFLIQFSVACACLAVSESTENSLIELGWKHANPELKELAQENFQCCGYTDVALPVNDTTGMGHPSCFNIVACKTPTCVKEDDCCSPKNATCECGTCAEPLMEKAAKAFSTTGGVSLFFSFTEIAGAILAGHYRNLYSSGI